MNSLIRTAVVAVFGTALWMSATNAATLTLSGSTDSTLITTNKGFALSVREQGFNYRTDTRSRSGQMLSLQDNPGLTRSIVKSLNGDRFDLLNANIRGQSRIYRTGRTDFDPNGSTSFASWAYHRMLSLDNFAIYGFRNGSMVASQRGLADFNSHLVTFSNQFIDLDKLVIRLIYPQSAQVSFGPPQTTAANTVWCDQWCGNVWIDDMTVKVNETAATVPIPPAAALLGSGLLGLILVGRRRRKAS